MLRSLVNEISLRGEREREREEKGIQVKALRRAFTMALFI